MRSFVIRRHDSFSPVDIAAASDDPFCAPPADENSLCRRPCTKASTHPNPCAHLRRLPDDMEEDRLWKFRRPEWLNSVWARNAGIYASGALFSIAFYVMLDSAVWSKSPKNGSNVHVKFVDWLPIVFSSLGMLIINSVEKQRLSADSFSYSGSGVAWKARVVLFLGFAALAGGMAGGVTVFVLKFAVPGVAMPALNMGIENLVSNALVGLRQVSVVLWVSQNMEDEYSYNLSI
ncbi:hypothetical protein E4U42_006013 [Claviceps africana]|uniref:Vacuolar protein sorting-associated protein 68 n=1 Tax=Claviceps africana TaxID=83212 RepID=A0A8K0NJL7_9HYPO|nr:hypothetical protein E4U42_006013 [Claviceps africana]